MMGTRRKFLKKSSFGLAAVTIFPVFNILDRIKSNGVINVAIVGVGGRGEVGVFAINESPLARIVAFSDVDYRRASKIFKIFPDIPRFKDFRIMLDKMDARIDAVVIATPPCFRRSKVNEFLRSI